MIFLIQYDRSTGSIIKMQTFEDSERQKADDARFEVEIALNRLRIEREVVILEAESEEALRKTHRRYFESLRELAEAAASSCEQQ